MEGWDIALLRMLPPPCELSDQGANIVALMDWVDAARPLLRLRATSRRLEQCAAPHFDSWATQYSASGLGPTLFDTLCGDTWHRTGLSGVCCGTTPQVRRPLCSSNLENGSPSGRQQQARQHQIGNSLCASHPKLSCPVPCELRHRDICVLDCRWTRGHDEGVAHLCDPCWNWWQLPPEDEAEPQQSASSGSQPHSSSPAEIDLPYCHRCDGVILAQVEVVAVCRRCFNVFHDWCLRLHYPHCRGPYRIPGAFAIPDPRCFCHSCRPWRTRVHYF